MTGDMGPIEAIVTIALALIAAWTSWLGLRKKPKPEKPDAKAETQENGTVPDPLRREDIEYIRDPGTQALALALNMSERLERVEEQNAALAKENRDFRGVVLGVIHRLERMPPFTADDILSYIREHLPSFQADLPNHNEGISNDPPR